MSCYPINQLEEIKEYYDREGIVCVKNLLSDAHVLSQRVSELPLHNDIRVASRKTVCLPNHHSVSKTMYADKSLQQLFYHLHQYRLQPNEFPLEYREYQPYSNGMNWHRDLAMFEYPYQVEMVYTVFNNDDKTRFEWEDTRGQIQTIQPKPNDMVFVRPNGPLHRVTSLGGNKRGIIKMVGRSEETPPLPAMYREKGACPMLTQKK